jgi:hypothetical protein
MTIKHLIIAGGGILGLQYMAALEHLNKSGYWLHENIESIYATSIGTFIGAVICLKYDWETVNKYFVERPWQDVFKINGKQILDSFYNKGIYDKKIMDIVFKPLLEAKDLSLNITLKEFFEYSKIEFHLYTFDQNKFETTDLSYKTHPNLPLTQAIFMSCAIPGIFTPTIMDGGCYIDGGAIDNYPIEYCLKNNPIINDESDPTDEMLGITLYRDYSDLETFKNMFITEESTLLDFAIAFFANAMNQLFYKTVKVLSIRNQVNCKNDGHFKSIDVMKEFIKSAENRSTWLQKGYEDAKLFLEKFNCINETNDESDGVEKTII